MIEPVFHYFGNKAGVEGADKIKSIIDETTKGSEYYKRQQEKRTQTLQKIEKMKQELINYHSQQQKVQTTKEIIQNKEKEIQINTDRIWAHFDMDMFFVACELLDRPELIEKPVAVGSSIVSTANYVARKFGVRSAMPTFVAKKLCPDIVLIPCHFEKYKTCSNIFMTILKQYDENLESMGLDEANLDLTNYIAQENVDPFNLCEKIRNQIFLATKLTASCGVGPNKMIAKLASEQNKPNGLFIVSQDRESVLTFLQKLPVRKIPGIGNVTEQILSGLNFNTCLDVRQRADELMIIFTPKTFDYIFYSCWGCSRNYHIEFEDQLSISCQRTFQSISTINEFEEKVDYISEKLAEDMQSEEKVGNHLTLTVKTSKFEIKSKSLQLNIYTNQAKQISQYGKQLLKIMALDEPIRLLGLKMGSLKNEKQFEKQSIQNFFKKKEESISNISNIMDNSIQQSINSKSKFDNINSQTEEQLQKQELAKQIQQDILSDDQASNISNQILSGMNSKSHQEIKQQNQQYQQQLYAKPKIFQCPICQNEIDCKGNNTLMNKHIDRCMNSTSSIIIEQSDESNKKQSENKNSKIFKKQSKK